MTATYPAIDSPDTALQFPAAVLYDKLRHCNQPSAIRERAFFGYSERHLQCVWADQNLRPARLTTIRGEPVTVLNPGRWNSEAGPDFLDALLEIGPQQRRIRGDVEIHISPADWNAHGHADDPHFHNVIAHVTYNPPGRPLRTLPPGAVEIALREPLAALPSFSFEAIDITAYPYTPLPSRDCPCAAELCGMPPEAIEALLEAAGTRRLQNKTDRLCAELRSISPDQLLYTEIMGALGYKHNTAAFRQLAAVVPYEVLAESTPLDAYALLLGIAGLMPAGILPRWDADTRNFIRQVWDRWWQQRDQWESAILPPKTWKLSSIRPQNHPVRRLAAVAAFICRREPPAATIAQVMNSIASNKSPTPTKDALVEIFQAPPPLDYWHRHISLASPRRPKPIAIVGSSRTAAIYTNVLLPFAAATGNTAVAKLSKTIPPEQNNAIIKQTAHALLGADHNPLLYSKNGLRQQGLIQIFRDFCLPDRSACRNCPLPAAIRKYRI